MCSLVVANKVYKRVIFSILLKPTAKMSDGIFKKKVSKLNLKKT